jgi:hypothetical protein
VFFTIVLLCSMTDSIAQPTGCVDEPPLNTHLANSPWPIMHRNSFAQATTCFAGPRANDSITLQTLNAPFSRTSTWLYFTERYANGKRAILGSSATHVFKAVQDAAGLRVIDSFRIDFNTLDYSWNHLLLSKREWISYDFDDVSGQNKLFKFTDQDTNNLYSPIMAIDTFVFPAAVKGKISLFNVTYDGWIAFNSTGGSFGVVKRDFSDIRILQLPLGNNEIAWHNNFPVDADNSMYVVTTEKMIRINWNGNTLSIGWTAPYDFVADGPTNTIAKGSGTTPTLIGTGTDDKLVVVCDGHNRNNLVAFWRDQLPAGWTGLPGKDIRVASVTPLPFVNLNNGFQSVENSPCARGYDIACAQFNGFAPGCINAKGVVKCRWNTATDKMSVEWTNMNVNMNGVLTYSSATNLVYSSGKETDCNYYFYGLDWNTGNVVVRQKLGTSELYNDQGCNTSINDDSTLVYGSNGGFALLSYKKNAPAGSNPGNTDDAVLYVYPNPVKDLLTLRLMATGASSTYYLGLYNLAGQKVGYNTLMPGDTLRWNLGAFPKGLYTLRLEGGPHSKRILITQRKIIVLK